MINDYDYVLLHTVFAHLVYTPLFLGYSWQIPLSHHALSTSAK